MSPLLPQAAPKAASLGAYFGRGAAGGGDPQPCRSPTCTSSQEMETP